MIVCFFLLLIYVDKSYNVLFTMNTYLNSTFGQFFFKFRIMCELVQKHCKHCSPLLLRISSLHSDAPALLLPTHQMLSFIWFCRFDGPCSTVIAWRHSACFHATSACIWMLFRNFMDIHCFIIQPNVGQT